MLYRTPPRNRRPETHTVVNIPNLGYGKGKATKQTAEMKLQDEHNCLSFITNQIIKIHEEGGF
jgi:hypothetical protein